MWRRRSRAPASPRSPQRHPPAVQRRHRHVHRRALRPQRIRLPDPAGEQPAQPGNRERAGQPELGELRREHRARARTCTRTSAPTRATASPTRSSAPSSRRCRSSSPNTAKNPIPGPYPVPANAPVEGGGRNGHGDRTCSSLQEGSCKLYELYDASAQGRGLGSGLGRGLQPAQRTRCAPKAGPRPTPPACRSSRCSCATRRSRAGQIDHALRVTVPAHPARLHPPGDALRLEQLRPEPAADGPAPAAEGELQPRRLPRRVARDPRSAQALRADRRRQRLVVVHHRRARTRAGTTKTSNRSSGSPGRHSKRSKAGRSCTPADAAALLAVRACDGASSA